jgi:hypothetical protein
MVDSCQLWPPGDREPGKSERKSCITPGPTGVHHENLRNIEQEQKLEKSGIFPKPI